VFSGAQTDTAPTSATSMADLTAAPATSDLFHNDQYIATNRIDEQTSTQTGMLGDASAPAFSTPSSRSRPIVDANGPFTGKLTDTQTQFLKGMLGAFDARLHDVVDGSGQERRDPETLRVRPGRPVEGQADTLTGMVGGIVDVDMADAVTRLRRLKLAVQASAQVFSSLQASSLLNVLK
jgi:flagellar hook-associated protein 3 FlgL